MEGLHIHHLAVDYCLNLLPLEQRQLVERHACGCEPCRQALAREQRLASAVRATLTTVTIPAPGRLRQIQRFIPTGRQRLLSQFGGQLRLATIALVISLVIGAVTLGPELSSGGEIPFGLTLKGKGWRQPPPDVMAMTATNTVSPTMTVTNTATATLWPRPDAVEQDGALSAAKEYSAQPAGSSPMDGSRQMLLAVTPAAALYNH